MMTRPSVMMVQETQASVSAKANWRMPVKRSGRSQNAKPAERIASMMTRPPVMMVQENQASVSAKANWRMPVKRSGCSQNASLQKGLPA
ncbi:hypothetical protein [Methylovorus mays]|uniref:hypothetical protein n=1 Tax=Methylovorus mays TaxID=184077 RepID=UPI001E5504D1|nr:hypothetical protein [Methylovorus mays]MCB5205859.1 hypothetical protein [Methylovorus mays]